MQSLRFQALFKLIDDGGVERVRELSKWPFSLFYQVYGPCILLVVISWVSFWLNREATSDRISLGEIPDLYHPQYLAIGYALGCEH